MLKLGTNPNGGIDWARFVRIMDMKNHTMYDYFEIGNEMQQAFGKDNDGKTSQGYWTDYVEGGSEKAYTEGGIANFDTEICCR